MRSNNNCKDWVVMSLLLICIQSREWQDKVRRCVGRSLMRVRGEYCIMKFMLRNWSRSHGTGWMCILVLLMDWKITLLSIIIRYERCQL